MDTKQKLEEVRDILDALLSNPKCHKSILRAHDLLESALGDFFDDEDDVAVIGGWFEDEPPFPAA
jgi:hypothetical protein